MSYKYDAGTNQLNHIKDTVNKTRWGNGSSDIILDIDDQPNNNYSYDPIGNLVKDSAESIHSITWSVYGKIKEIVRDANIHDPTTDIKYTYDAQGNRLSKVVSKTGTSVRDYAWYVRDAQGNVMSIYTASGDAADTSLQNLSPTLDEVYLYGSSRLGTYHSGLSVDEPLGDVQYFSNFTYWRRFRQYELTNHLGNVITTISDRKIAVPSGDSSLNVYFEPDIIAANDYYPFGMLSRVATSSTGVGYRYGFNGKEDDFGAKGSLAPSSQDQLDYGNRIYDPRVGRFLSVDPLQAKYPELTPFQFASNSPIRNLDIDGREGGWYLNSENERVKQLGNSYIAKQKQDDILANAPPYIPNIVHYPQPGTGRWNQPISKEQRAWQTEVNEKNWVAAGYNSDGSKPWIDKVMENKHFKGFANNIALPMLEGYTYLSGTGELKAAFKGAVSLLGEKEFTSLAETGVLNPKSIRFSQNSISSTFKSGTEVQSLIDALKGGQKIEMEPIRIVVKDSKVYTLDNRRLFAYQQAGVEIPYVKLNVVPNKELFKFTTTNNGISVEIRTPKKTN